MKNLKTTFLIILSILTITFTSCKKQEDVNPSNYSKTSQTTHSMFIKTTHDNESLYETAFISAGNTDWKSLNETYINTIKIHKKINIFFITKTFTDTAKINPITPYLSYQSGTVYNMVIYYKSSDLNRITYYDPRGYEIYWDLPIDSDGKHFHVVTNPNINKNKYPIVSGYFELR